MTLWLPSNYERPASPSRYYKFEQGDNKFRILSKPIIGWVDWKEENGARSPIRTTDKPEKSHNPKKPAKHFWAFVIWSYRDNDIRVMEITQATIQDAIIELHRDENWGDPTGYDMNVRKKGEKMETEYKIVPTPPKPLADEISATYLATKVDLNKLFTNEDPFSGEASGETKSVDEEEATATEVKDGDIDVSNIPF